MIWHILERFVIHFTSATSLVLVMFMLLRSLARHGYTNWLPTWRASLIVAALFVFAVSTTREAYDVANGQPLVKAFTDYASWLLGCGVAAWGLTRFGKEINA